MVLNPFRRRRPDPAGGTEAFWAWWGTAKDGVDAAVRAGRAEDVAAELGAQVAAVHPELDWELAPGLRSRHALVVTSGGAPALRHLAQRWLLAGPPADEVWEYADTRRASWQPGAVLQLDGSDVALDDLLVVAVRDERWRLDVVVHHPAMPALPEETRATLAFLALDWLLGEDAVEQWVGAVDTAPERPDGAVPASQLPDAVASLAREASAGEESWSLLSGGTDDRPALALARLPQPRFEDLQRIDHVRLRLPFRDVDAVGLPGDASLQALRDLEDQVVDAAGHDGVLVAHETSGGVRELHLYARDGREVADRLAPLASAWAEGRAQVAVTHDPGWEAVRHLR